MNSKEKEFDIEQIKSMLPSMLGKAGWLIPSTEEEVIAAEKRLEKNPIEIPTHLIKVPDATDAAIKKFREESEKRRIRKGNRFFLESNEIEANLTQVARHGADIPLDIKQKMNEDRQKSEKDIENEEPT